MDIAFQHEQEPKSRSSSLWKRMKNIFLLSSFLGLLSFNIATLINDKLHTAAFNVLGSVLGYTLGSAFTDQILSDSPTVIRRQDVEVKTNKLAKEKMELVKDKETLTKNNTALQEKHTKLKTESAKRSDAVQKASKRMASRTIAGATRNIASLPGEAIPVLGTALIIGVTTWDIYDFCENLKDLNELNAVFEHQLEDQDKVCGMKVPTKEQVMDEVRENWEEAYRTAADQINQIEVTVPKTPPIMTWDEFMKEIKEIFDFLNQIIKVIVPETPPIMTLDKIKEKISDFFYRSE